MGTAEELRGAGHVAGGEESANTGRRVGLVSGIRLGRNEAEPHHLESEIGAHVLEQCDVAAPLVAEVEVGPHHHDPGPEHPDEHILDERLRGLLAAAPRRR